MAGDGRREVDAHVSRRGRDADHATDVFAGHLVWVAFRVTLAASVFLVVAAVLGGVLSVWGVLAIPAAVLGALALAAPLAAFAVTQESDLPFALIMRIGVFPLFLFSGTFFPVSQLPDWLQPLGAAVAAVPLGGAVPDGDDGHVRRRRRGRQRRRAARVHRRGVRVGRPHLQPEAHAVTTTQPSSDTAVRPRRPLWFLPGTIVRRPLRVVERNAIVYRRGWLVFLSGLVEPFLYLLSIGIGVGALVGKVPGPNGVPVEYDAFVAPGLMAAAAMNGAVLDTTFNFFIKLKYSHTYDAMLATPLGVRDVAVGRCCRRCCAAR